jgi:hypothetical protein
MSAPGYWMHETSGALRPAIETYLAGKDMSEADCAAIRAYLRQWIMADGWHPASSLDDLRRRIDGLVGRDEIAAWIYDAELEGIDPL